LTTFAHAWSDVLELTLALVLKDQELSEVLKWVRPPSASAEAHAEDTPRRRTLKTRRWCRKRPLRRPNRPTKNWC